MSQQQKLSKTECGNVKKTVNVYFNMLMVDTVILSIWTVVALILLIHDLDILFWKKKLFNKKGYEIKIVSCLNLFFAINAVRYLTTGGAGYVILGFLGVGIGNIILQIIASFDRHDKYETDIAMMGVYINSAIIFIAFYHIKAILLDNWINERNYYNKRCKTMTSSQQKKITTSIKK